MSARSAQRALRDMVAAMSMPQLAQAASAAGIPRAQLIAFCEGRTELSELSRRRLGEYLLVGKVFLKEDATCHSN